MQKSKEFVSKIQQSGQLCELFFISYAAMTNVFSFLPPYEVLCFQRSCRFMYDRGVERVQKMFAIKASLTYLPCRIDQFRLICLDRRGNLHSLINLDLLERELGQNVYFELTSGCQLIQWGYQALVFQYIDSQRVNGDVQNGNIGAKVHKLSRLGEDQPILEKLSSVTRLKQTEEQFKTESVYLVGLASPQPTIKIREFIFQVVRDLMTKPTNLIRMMQEKQFITLTSAIFSGILLQC